MEPQEQPELSLLETLAYGNVDIYKWVLQKYKETNYNQYKNIQERMQMISEITLIIKQSVANRYTGILKYTCNIFTNYMTKKELNINQLMSVIFLNQSFAFNTIFNIFNVEILHWMTITYLNKIDKEFFIEIMNDDTRFIDIYVLEVMSHQFPANNMYSSLALREQYNVNSSSGIQHKLTKKLIENLNIENISEFEIKVIKYIRVLLNAIINVRVVKIKQILKIIKNNIEEDVMGALIYNINRNIICFIDILSCMNLAFIHLLEEYGLDLNNKFNDFKLTDIIEIMKYNNKDISTNIKTLNYIFSKSQIDIYEMTEDTSKEHDILNILLEKIKQTVDSRYQFFNYGTIFGEDNEDDEYDGFYNIMEYLIKITAPIIYSQNYKTIEENEKLESKIYTIVIFCNINIIKITVEQFIINNESLQDKQTEIQTHIINNYPKNKLTIIKQIQELLNKMYSTTSPETLQQYSNIMSI